MSIILIDFRQLLKISSFFKADRIERYIKHEFKIILQYNISLINNYYYSIQ
jgi:hypothetical protein